MIKEIFGHGLSFLSSAFSCFYIFSIWFNDGINAVPQALLFVIPGCLIIGGIIGVMRLLSTGKTFISCAPFPALFCLILFLGVLEGIKKADVVYGVEDVALLLSPFFIIASISAPVFIMGYVRSRRSDKF